MKLSVLAHAAGGELLGGDAEIKSLCTDSRVAGAGDLFFCIRGTHEDSHAYAAEAERRGAAALVAEHPLQTSLPCVLVKDARRAMSVMSATFYHDPQEHLHMIGVTGTNGKTTVTHMLYSILTVAGKRAGLIGTLGARYADTVIPPSLTTPDPVALFSLLADMRDGGVGTVAMEVSAHALALEKDAPILYDAAIFTNFTQDHLDFFKTMEAYGEAKKSLFPRCRLGILNADDPFSSEIAKVCTSVVTYGLEEPADCFALIDRENVAGSDVLLNLEDELIGVHIPLTGRHNVYNALAAAVCARRLGVGAEAIAKGLAATKVEGRLEYIGERNGGKIFVDFAHTPDGLEKSLSALREHTDGKLYAVFGCGGNRDRGKRPIMGETVAKNCDFAVITSDNPRFEDPCAIIAEIEEGYKRVSREYVAVEEREKAISYALQKLEQGDVLLIAGKGGETTQEIMGIKYAYSDKETVLSMIGGGDAH